MLAWIKTIAVLATSVVLMGSKIIIEVPAGGSVASSSGLITCAAGEQCVIEMNEQYFAETFTAIPAAGHAFSSWGDTPGILCRASAIPDCSELDDDPFSPSAADDPQRHTGVYRLTPEFAGENHPVDESALQFAVSSLHSTRYYQVHGNTPKEIWAQLHGAANPLAVDRRAGVKPVAHADFSYQYHYQSSYVAGATTCRVASGKLELKFETVLPRLAANANTSERLMSRWLVLAQRITEHEAGHHAIYRQLGAQLPAELAAIGAVPCQQLDNRVKLAVADLVSNIRRESAEYDEHDGNDAYLASAL
jgi:predicted secreted Zn-dependent protease